VMSFPMDELRPGTHEAPAEGLLGDIVISPTVAAEHAERGGHKVADEIALLVTHGLLHLLGFDHHDEDEKHKMFSTQDQLLEQFLGYTPRSEEHTSELQSRFDLVCRLLLEKKKHTTHGL